MATGRELLYLVAFLGALATDVLAVTAATRGLPEPLTAPGGVLAAPQRADDASEGTARPCGPWVPEEARARFRNDLEALCAPELGGRAAWDEGGRRTVTWLQRAFEDAGLAPLDVGGAAPLRCQEFSFADPRPPRFSAQGTRCALRSRGSESAEPIEAFRFDRDFVPFGFSPDGEVEAPVVFVGYGLRIPELGLDDYAARDCAGRIVLALRGGPGWKERGSPLNGHRESLRFSTKIEHAVRAGAVAFLLVDPDDPSDPTDPDGDAGLLARVPRTVGFSEIPAVWLSRSCAERVLQRCGIDLAVRRGRLDAGDRTALEASAQPRIGIRVQADWRPGPVRSANVFGVVPGRAPAEQARWVVVGAHHDHLGNGAFASLDEAGGSRLHPGADDNASGVAAMLLTARALAAIPLEERGTAWVLFAAFGAEELGTLGSRAFVDAAHVDPKRIVAMLNLDMVGRATPERFRVEGVGTGEGLAELVAAAADRALGRQVALREGVARRSDHLPFLLAEVPVLFFHSGPHEDYHRPSDTPDRILVDEAVDVAALCLAVTRQLAAAGIPPSFVEPPAPRWKSWK